MSNKLKKTTALLLCVSILLVTASAAVISQAYSADGFDFEIYYNEWVEIENYSGSEQTVIIPEKLGGLPVRNIGRNSFAGSNMTKVVFPETVRCIYSGAFNDCRNLSEIELNAGLESIYSCFKNTAFEKISVPSSVEYISADTFSGCALLKEIRFKADYRKELNITGAESFGPFSSGASVVIEGTPSAALDITLQNMMYQRSDTGSEYVYAPSDGGGLSEIYVSGDYSYTLTDGKAEIVKFLNPSASEITVPSQLDGYEVVSVGEFAFSPVTEVGDDYSQYIESASVNAGKITLPDGIKSIGRYAFACNENLEEIKLPGALENLGYCAFYNCASLSSVLLPASLKVVEDYTFSNCNLESLTLSEGTKALCSEAFGLSPDAKPVIPDSIEYMGKNVFGGYSAESITLPRNLKVLDGAFENAVSIRSVEFNDEIKSINKNTFSGCENLSEIYLPDSLDTLGSEAFYGCKNLKEIRLSSNLDTIGEAAFAECTSLDLVIWNPERKIILKDAFKNCPLRSFDFSNSNGVGAGAFKESKIEKVKIGESAQPEVKQSIGTMSFMSCEKLETAVIGGNISEIGSLAFADCENLEKVVIADSVEKIAADAFDDSQNVTIYCLEDSYAEGYALSQSIKVTTLRIDAIPNQTYTSKEIKPALTVRFSSQKLASGRDYKADYYNNLNVGTASVMVSGLGDYSMLMSKADFAIVARNISDADVIVTKQMTYNNEPCIPEVTVKFAGKTLSENKDYTVTLKNNESVGTGTVRIKGIGNFKGTSDYDFEIREEEQSTAQKIIEAVITLWRRFISWIKTIFS